MSSSAAALRASCKKLCAAHSLSVLEKWSPVQASRVLLLQVQTVATLLGGVCSVFPSARAPCAAVEALDDVLFALTDVLMAAREEGLHEKVVMAALGALAAEVRIVAKYVQRTQGLARGEMIKGVRVSLVQDVSVSLH
jgi:hypothetical protein